MNHSFQLLYYFYKDLPFVLGIISGDTVVKHHTPEREEIQYIFHNFSTQFIDNLDINILYINGKKHEGRNQIVW
jgi:hypothetical protein